MPLYIESSTLFLSTNINLSSSGLNLYKRESIIVERQTLLPEPVVPATSKCGASDISDTTLFPYMPLPNTNGISSLDCLKSVLSKTSLK